MKKGFAYYLNTATFLLMLLWVYASLSKLVAFGEFHDQMNLQVFGRTAAGILIYVVPLAELCIAGLLAFDITNLKGLVASCSLLVLFTVYVSLVTFHFFSSVPCSCGGILQKLGWIPHLIFNLFFLTLNISAIIIYNRKEHE